jgi:hypothetical protein
MTTSSNRPIKAKEDFHAKATFKTAAEKRTASRKTQSGIIQTIRSSAGGLFSPVR